MTSTGDSFIAQMDYLVALSRTLNEVVDLDWLYATVLRAQAEGPLIDPTGYRDGGAKRLGDQEKFLAAAINLRDTVKEIADAE